MKKKVVSILLSAALATGILAGCGSGNSETETTASRESSVKESTSSEETTEVSTAESGEKVKIRMTYWNSEDTVESLLNYLAAAVPDVEIEYQFIDNSNYNTVVDTQLSAGEGPDIICESPASSLKHAKLGYLESLDDLGSLYSDAGTSVYSYDGSVYALPGISWFEGIYYNKALFEENNIELPKTFDEYITVCKEFQELGIAPLAAGLKSWEPMLKNSMAFVTAEYLSTPEGKDFGEKYRNGETTLDGVWNSYLEKWSEMITEGIYTTDMTGIDHDQALDEFATGQAAMFCSGPWDLEAIQSKNPDLEIDMMPFYGTQESAGWLIGGPGCGFAVNSASENKEAAMKVLEALSTVEGQEAFWQDNQGGSSYLEGADFELPTVYDGAASALEAGNVYCPWNEWGDAASAHETYGTEMQSYLLGTQDLSTTLSNVDAAVKELLEK
ncbi:MAG: extracellular solute-binding protein [Eubacteriales bacterium]|nr:extracellular solute-binding protein [Eubacteriales bacterium]